MPVRSMTPVRTFRRTQRLLAAAVIATCCQAGWAQVTPATILEVDLESGVLYFSDVSDVTKFATDPKVTAMIASPRNFGLYAYIGDIVAMNGKPAKGTALFRGQSFNLTPAPNPGQALADMVRTGVSVYTLEIQQADGTPVGSIFAVGLSGGPAAPGAPLAVTTSNNAVVGGTGAFLGARGQLGGLMYPNTAPYRVASHTEDPANRRVNGGGRFRMVVHLIPMSRPEITVLPTGPAVFHGEDFSPVTAEKPARVGERLVMSVANLGPTKPGLDPGKPFPPFQDAKLLEVNSPLEVTVNGKAAAVVIKAGWPSLNNVYRVDFVIPEGTASGLATVGISAAWIAGPEVKIPVQ